MGGKNYADLIAWQKAMDLVEMIYRLTNGFPRDERFDLTSQLHRSAISIPSNIAEGQGRYSKREFVRFLSIAHGSLREVETQVLIAMRLGYAGRDNVNEVVTMTSEVGRLITGLSKSLKEKL